MALCYRGLRFPAGAVGWAAVSGIDLALWGPGGQAGRPAVYQLLGGPYRDRVWVYFDVVTGEPADMAEEARAMAGDHGFTAFKLFPYSPDDDRLPWQEAIRLVTERVAAVRAAVGDAAEIGVDFHAKLEEPVKAAEMARAIEPYRPMFNRRADSARQPHGDGGGASRDESARGHRRKPLRASTSSRR